MYLFQTCAASFFVTQLLENNVQQSSTVTCSWSVTSVVDYFTKRGATVYGAAMDMSKAFDMVNWCELYSTLRKRNINPLILRLMLNIYKTQKCNVLWNGEKSKNFKVSNGVRQGAVISAISSQFI